MNSIAFTPNYSSYAVGIKKNNCQNRPAFTGLSKTPNRAQTKHAMNFAEKLYTLFFVPGKEEVVKMSNGTVMTKVKGAPQGKKIVKKYDKWSSRPLEALEDNTRTKIREHKVYNSDGTYDVTFKDMHAPQFDISVGYKGLVNKEYTFGAYDGPVSLKYCDKSLDLSAEQRGKLIDELDDSVNKKYGDIFDQFLHDRSKFNFEELSNKFYKDPEVIGSAILKSPKYLEEQLSTIPSSMPYGIECIMSKVK